MFAIGCAPRRFRCGGTIRQASVRLSKWNNHVRSAGDRKIHFSSCTRRVVSSQAWGLAVNELGLTQWQMTVDLVKRLHNQHEASDRNNLSNRRRRDGQQQKLVVLRSLTASNISRECRHGPWMETLDWLDSDGMQVDITTYASLLQWCSTTKALSQGKRLHSHIIENGHDRNRYLGNLLMQMYRKCGALEDAREVFSKMDQRNVVSWTIMIGAYAQHGRCKDALKLFQQMQFDGVMPNKITFLSILSACTNQSAFAEGKRMHASIAGSALEADVAVGNALVNMYGKCGSLEDAQRMFEKMSDRNVVSWNVMIAAYGNSGNAENARRMFDRMPQRTVISWNSMIAAYVQCDQGKEALCLFQQMQQEGFIPDKVTCISMLDACASLADLREGRCIHSLVVNSKFESDVVVATALVNMYGKCGSLEDARSIFAKMVERNVVSWTAMITAYTQHGYGKEALNLFQQMQLEGYIPDKVTFISLLDACASQASLTEGRLVHACVVDSKFESDVVVGTAVVDMYGKCGSVEDARRMFDKMYKRNVISWNAMIAGYALHGQGKEAFQLFRQMQSEDIIPNKSTFVSVIDACANQVSLAEGRQIHALIEGSDIELDVVVGTALINFYGKCGSLGDARRIFDKMPEQNMVSWTAMIAVYAHHGQGMEALQLFQQMQLQDVSPNKVTFVSILSACSHCGLMDEGCYYFVSMSRDHGVVPTAEHYNCMIDSLGRAGRLDEGEDLIDSMPLQPTPTSWMALLGACRMLCDLERGNRAAKHVFDLDPEKIAPYVSLSNIYAAISCWDDVINVRKKVQNKYLKF